MGTVNRRRLNHGAAVLALLTLALGLQTAPPSAAAQGCGPTGVVGGEWRSYGQDLSNTRHQDKELTIGLTDVSSLSVAWMHDSGAAYNNTPIIADGCVYLAASNGVVTAHNADTGELVWSTDLETKPTAFGGGVVGSPAVDGDRLFVIVNQEGSPYLQALDRNTGERRWAVVLSDQELASSNSSPVAFNGMVFAGFSGNAGPGTVERGGYVIVDSTDGEVLATQHVIPDDAFANGYHGAGVWSTPAIDLDAGYAYVGTSNPHSSQLEHERANSIIKVDISPGSATFGTIVDHYKGLPDTYLPGLSEQPVCETYPNAYYVDRFSASCLQIDLDFGASPTLFTSEGRTLIGGLQKAGVFHAIDPTTMDGVWQTVVGVPCLACNAASPASHDGSVFTAAGPPGQLFRLRGSDGLPTWAGVVNGITSYNPVTIANGIVYTVDGGGFLNGFDARTGVQVLKRNLAFDTGQPMLSESTSSGIAVARNTLYVAALGHVIALRLGGAGGGVPTPPELPGAPSGAGGAQVIAGPGAVVTTYATANVTMPQGGSLTLTNLDVPQHDVLSDDVGLFGSPLIGPGQSTPVAGVDALAAGTYGFYCSLHRNMRGTLTVTAG